MLGKILVPFVAALIVAPALAQIPIGPIPATSTTSLFVQHPGGPVGPNWAGVAVKIQLMDNTELDIVSITNTFSGNPANVGGAFTTFPFRSTPSASSVTAVPMVFPVWITSSAFGGTPNGSGISASFGNPQNAVRLNIHVQGTTPINNGDIDFTVMVGNIFHVNTGREISRSAWIAPSTGAPFVLGNTTLVSSGFFARFPFGTLAYGIEHADSAIPEPASVALMGGGLACLLIGLGIRRRRQSPEA